ncbi:MAG: hypothetical protein WCK78_13025 [Paludibacter sp.]
MFKDAYDHCKSYRNEKTLPNGDIVVILTSNPEAKNWFSHYDLEGNIYVVTHDISDGLKHIEEKYFCAYELVCNILQNAMQLDVNEPKHWEKYIHFSPEGCMNDFCVNKTQIRLKFRTADICPSCYQYALKMGVTTPMILQIKSIAEKIRTEVITVPELNVNEISDIVFDFKTNSIYLQDSLFELNLINLPKAIYVFFMMHPEGFSLHQFRNIDYDFFRIYSWINLSSDKILSKESITKTTKNLRTGDTLSKKISEINTKIKKNIGEPLANAYCIVYENTKYKINLPKEKIRIIE